MGSVYYSKTLICSYHTFGVLLYLMIVGSIEYTHSKKIDNAEVCLTSGCLSAANLIKSNVDVNEQPCDDFYKFSCGGFINNTAIPKNKQSIDHLDGIKEKVLREVRQIVNKKIHDKENKISKLVKNYFRACKRETAEAKNDSLNSLMGHIDKLGGWPVIVGKKWNESKFDAFETDYKLRLIGYRPKSILSVYVFNDLFNTSRNFLYIGPPQAEIKSDIFKRGFMNNVVQAYYHYMVDIAVILGAKRSRAKLELRKALDLEQELTFATSIPKITTIINLRRIEDLERNISFVPWLEYINKMTLPVVAFEADDVVNIADVGYLTSLEYFLKKTPKKVLANYMIWKMIAESAIYLTDEIREKTFQYKHIKSQKTIRLPKKPRWQECIELLSDRDNGLMVGVSSMYVRKHFKEETKQDVKEIMSFVNDGFKNILENITWMDASTKIAAMRKNEFMKQIIAYPDELLSETTINNYVDDLELYPNNHFQNYLNLQRFHFEYELSGINTLTNNSLWTIFSDSTVVNAYYYAADNTIVLLAALLQPPLYDPNWPSYVKFGSIGFVIGHEIMHAYDARRYMYDERGSLNPWITGPTKTEFKSRIKCLEKQYNKFVDPLSGMHVDGSMTINENLADNGGISIAYHAYKNWMDKYGVEAGLPDLSYNTTQLFWISAMSFLCSKDTTQHMKDSLTNDVHTPDKFRALGIVQNSPEFAKAFNCPADSPMNPTKKCELW